MKTLQKLCFSTALIVSAVVYSCQKQKGADAISPMSTKDVALKQATSKSQKLLSWQPEGSKFDKTENGYILTPPKGWAYAGFDQNGNHFNLVSNAGKTISCTCNNSSGRCKPFDASGPGGTISGCGGPCTDCTMKQSASMENNPIDILTGGYYEVAASTKILKNGESAPAVFDALFQLPAFKAALDKFYAEAYEGRSIQLPVKDLDGSATAPKGHSLIGISIMGRGLVVVVPDKYAVKTIGYTTNGKASCSCSNGTCELKDWKVLGTGAIWCDGDCTTCTLTTSDLSITNNYAVSISSYSF